MTDKEYNELYRLLEELRAVMSADPELTNYGKEQIEVAIDALMDYINPGK